MYASNGVRGIGGWVVEATIRPPIFLPIPTSGRISMKHHHSNKERVKSIRRKYSQGKSCKELRDEFELDYSAISNIIHNNTWIDSDYTPPERKCKRLTKEQDVRVKHLKEFGHSYDQIMKLMNLSKSSVRAILVGERDHLLS